MRFANGKQWTALKLKGLPQKGSQRRLSNHAAGLQWCQVQKLIVKWSTKPPSYIRQKISRLKTSPLNETDFKSLTVVVMYRKCVLAKQSENGNIQGYVKIQNLCIYAKKRN